jgi:hypothetical protein
MKAYDMNMDNTDSVMSRCDNVTTCQHRKKELEDTTIQTETTHTHPREYPIH